MTAQQILDIEHSVAVALREVYDPEIPVNIYDLGLVYDIVYEPGGLVVVTMTLTAPNCPVADDLVQQVHDAAAGVAGVSKVEVVLTFDPEWTRDRMSEAALLELGML